MRILITGGTGFIGRPLVQALEEHNHNVVLLTRNPDKIRSSMSPNVTVFPWNPETEVPPKESLAGVDAIIHLAGESIAARRWTAKQKKKIFDSRVIGTKNLAYGIAQNASKPKVIVSASAVGIYGNRGDEVLIETSSLGSDFLADLCKEWEAALTIDTLKKIRRINLRLGMVLGKDGGALSKLLPLFKFWLGGPVGSGRQWMSWIHIRDLVELIRFVISNEELEGPVNAVAPNPVTNRNFAKALGASLRRPAWLVAPALALKVAMGELSEIVLASQRAEPRKAVESGFVFKYPFINQTFDDLFLNQMTQSST